MAAQRAFAVEPWGYGPSLPLRMALDTGMAESQGGDYFGPALNRAARLLAAGRGGQALLTEATRALLHFHMPEGIQVRDLGDHLLRDLLHPVRIFQLVVPDLPVDFSPLRSEPLRLLRVFLCHAHSDKRAVRDLYQKLLANRTQPWLDEEDLVPGQVWQEEIPKPA